MRLARVFLPILVLALAGCESNDVAKGDKTQTSPEEKVVESAPSEPAPPPRTQGQTFAEAIQVMCDAPLDKEIAAAAPAEQMKRIAVHIESKVTHKRARFAFQALSEIGPEERLSRMKGFVEEAKISKCALFELAQQAPAVAAKVEPAPAAPANTASAGEESEATIPFASHYIGKHKLGVNRVNDGKRNGKGQILREANALVLQASVKKGAYYLDISGIVEPVSKEEFVLDGQFSGIPDLSWRDLPPKKQSTKGRFTFRATKGRKFWRLYEVDGAECVCTDDCGNDFCYIDLSFR